ncbi:MAG TPA: pyridoxal-phosphate dependent enzyme [Gaiellaceae bacterium]|nr:pyridoxal-phosphate dependent enzyme [Gaiellaceae bacterium]
MTDLLPERIKAGVAEIPAVFQRTPQFVAERLSLELGRCAVVKVETLNPIGSFKGRGTSLLTRELDPAREWVCSTAGNFGQGVAFAARQRGAKVQVYVSPAVPGGKVASMRRLGATVDVCDRPTEVAREYAEETGERQLVVDGLDPAMAEGAGTIGLELAAAGPFDAAVVQLGDGALISGVACSLKSASPQTRVIGVCASGSPAMARSFAAGRPISDPGTGTIATAIAIEEPVPESFARVTALVDDVVLVDDDELRAAMTLIADALGVLVEPAGAAGVAALRRYGDEISGERVAVILTGALGT